MKLSTLAVATLTMSVIVAGAAFAQTDASSSPPGPAVTMQPIPNPPEAAKPMASAKGKHHAKHAAKHHKGHKKAEKAAEAAPAPATSK